MRNYNYRPLTLTITRGLPGSGKSTWTEEQQRKRDDIVRVNRDSLRETVFGGHGVLDNKAESLITQMQIQMVTSLLDKGYSVIVDDTHLRAKVVRQWYRVAKNYGGRVQFVVQDFDTPLETCILRDSLRSRSVGENVIRRMYERSFVKGMLPPLPDEVREPITPEPPVVYTPDPELPTAYIFDVDGTVAQMNGRGPFDWDRVGEDLPIKSVIDLANTLHAAGHQIIVMSGRDGVSLEDTEIWLMEHGFPEHITYMREQDNWEKDYIIKERLYREHIEGKWGILGVFDDRLQVVQLWYRLGLPVFRVGDPDARF